MHQSNKTTNIQLSSAWNTYAVAGVDLHRLGFLLGSIIGVEIILAVSVIGVVIPVVLSKGH